jgi:hypothetical protein
MRVICRMYSCGWLFSSMTWNLIRAVVLLDDLEPLCPQKFLEHSCLVVDERYNFVVLPSDSHLVLDAPT